MDSDTPTTDSTPPKSHRYNTRSKRKRRSPSPVPSKVEFEPVDERDSTLSPKHTTTCQEKLQGVDEFDLVVHHLRTVILTHIQSDLHELGIIKNNYMVKRYLASLKNGLQTQVNRRQHALKRKNTKENRLDYAAGELSTNVAYDMIELLHDWIQQGVDLSSQLSQTIQSWKQQTPVAMSPLSEEDDSDVDSHGNIKDLIDYQSDIPDEWYGQYQSLEQLCQEHNSSTSRRTKRPRIEIKIDTKPHDSDSSTSSEESESDSSASEDSEKSEDSSYSSESSASATEWADHYRIPEQHLLDSLDWKYIQTKTRKHQSENTRDVNYFRQLTTDKKNDMLSQLDQIQKISQNAVPLTFRALLSKMPIQAKAELVRKLETLGDRHSDNAKLQEWAQGVLKIPFGVYKAPFQNEDSTTNTPSDIMRRCQTALDSAVYGHNKAKNKILQILAQRITRPEQQSGLVLGIRGPMGNGKTTLVEKGVSEALGIPFTYIPLGGATDASFMEGHSYTYEGSQPGKIVEILTQAKCMNPIIFFDELDKVSTSHKGQEIINVLMHLTDPAQNNHFQDRYFTGVDLDLSKATIIFSYNDASLVNPILRDRITEIDTRGFKNQEKIQIVRDYMWTQLTSSVNRNLDISPDTIQYLIDNYTCEGGVRTLKKLLENIVREVNLRYIHPDSSKSTLLSKPVKDYPEPINLTTEMVCKDLMRDITPITQEVIPSKPEVGRINGLFATCNDTGGITVIEARMIPMSQPLTLQLTGQQGSVMKESMKVAESVAWQYVPSRKRQTLQKYWKDHPEGFHIHCPEGSTPKDGPSAGTAITVALLSLLLKNPIRNDIAITGEINLQGEVMEIGGLLHKCYGAYKAGVRCVFYPETNEKNMIQIRQECPELWTDPERFRAVSVKTLEDVLPHVFVNPL